MLSVSRLLNGTLGTHDALRYGRSTASSPAHLLHFTKDKKPVVVWNVGQRCNLHCAHCYSDSKNMEYPEELDTNEGLSLLQDLSEFGVPTILFSGGEPLMRPDIFELAQRATDLGMRTVLSTNGTLISSSVAREIADAGFSYVGVSLDGIGKIHDKIRGKKGAYSDAVTGIKNCNEAGIKTGVRYTVHQKNLDQLDAIFETAEQLEAGRVCVYHLAYAGRGDKIKKFDLEPAQTRTLVERIFDITEEMHSKDLHIEVLTVDNPVDSILLYKRILKQDPERADDVLTMLKWNGGNQSGIAIAAIDPNGNVHPDQFSWHQSAGNVRDRPFSEIWSDDDNPVLAPYRQKPRKLDGRCETCGWRQVCNGGLRVRAESGTGSTTASDPACYLSEEELQVTL